MVEVCYSLIIMYKSQLLSDWTDVLVFYITIVLIGQFALGMEVNRMFTVIDLQELTNREKPVLLYAKDLKVTV